MKVEYCLSFFFFCRGLNFVPYIFYVLFILTELNSRGQVEYCLCMLVKAWIPVLKFTKARILQNLLHTSFFIGKICYILISNIDISRIHNDLIN